MQTHAVNKVAEKSFVMQEREKSDLKIIFVLYVKIKIQKLHLLYFTYL